MTTQLKVIGKENIGKIEFTGIEGGFGDDKKAMLVKDIAKIHERQVKEVNKLINNNHNRPIKAINQAINMNRKRFKDGIDLLDLKFQSGSIKLTELFSKQQIANYNNIYLLSERGYAKLLKILDDDKAWDIYDKLVDNYFNMRVAIKNNEPSLVQQRRLSIMEDNAATRKASIMYKIAMATESDSGRQSLLARAAKELTGEMTIPSMKQKEYSAAEVGKQLGITSNMVG